MTTSLPVRKQIVIFTRFPKPGFAKTRLIPELSATGAALLQQRMTEHIIDQAARFAGKQPVQIEIRYQDGNENIMRNWLGPGYRYQAQGGGDLGAKMSRAFTEAFQAGMQTVLVLGTDCPSISREIIDKALTSLSTRDLVLGPARDGGYYLIGLSRTAPELFTGIPWGTDKTLQATLSKAGKSGLSFLLLEQLIDIDRPGDLAALPEFLKPR